MNNLVSKEELALLEVNTLGESLSTLIEQGTEMAINVFTSDEVSLVWEAVADVSAEIIKATKVIAVFKKVSSIPDKLFMKKLEKYCRGLTQIPLSKREKYAKKVGKTSLNKESVFILGVLNKIEELSKIDILLSLFEYKMDEIIDDNTYRRLMLMVDRTMFSDLIYLKSNITDNPIVIENDAEQGLLANGWLCYAGQSWGTADEDGQFLYNYTNTAKRFCELINII